MQSACLQYCGYPQSIKAGRFCHRISWLLSGKPDCGITYGEKIHCYPCLLGGFKIFYEMKRGLVLKDPVHDEWVVYFKYVPALKYFRCRQMLLLKSRHFLPVPVQHRNNKGGIAIIYAAKAGWQVRLFALPLTLWRIGVIIRLCFFTTDWAYLKE